MVINPWQFVLRLIIPSLSVHLFLVQYHKNLIIFKVSHHRTKAKQRSLKNIWKIAPSPNCVDPHDEYLSFY